MESRTASTPPKSAVTRVIGLAFGILGVVTFAALVFTIVIVVQAGAGGFFQFGRVTLLATWPTAIALAVIVFGPVLSVRLATPPYVGLSLLAVWILSALAYGVPNGAMGSFRNVLALLILTGTPLLPVFTLRTILAVRSRFRRVTQITIATAVAVMFWWLTAPIALVVSCFVAGNCP